MMKKELFTMNLRRWALEVKAQIGLSLLKHRIVSRKITKFVVYKISRSAQRDKEQLQIVRNS